MTLEYLAYKEEWSRTFQTLKKEFLLLFTGLLSFRSHFKNLWELLLVCNYFYYHRRMLLLMDQWYGLTIQDIRKLEEQTSQELEHVLNHLALK